MHLCWHSCILHRLIYLTNKQCWKLAPTSPSPLTIPWHPLSVSSHTPIGVFLYPIQYNSRRLCWPLCVMLNIIQNVWMASLVSFNTIIPSGVLKLWLFPLWEKYCTGLHTYFNLFFNLTPTMLYFHYRRSNMQTRLSFCPDNIYFGGGLFPEITWLVFHKP